MISKGTVVTQKMPPPIVGTVEGYSLDQETGEVRLRVCWPDADGSIHTIYLLESEIVT